MKHTLKVILIIASCIINQLCQAQTDDYSKSVKEPVKLLIDNLESTEASEINIEIVNMHNGIYRLNSRISNTDDIVTVSTHVKDMTDEESDSSFTYSLADFIRLLNVQIDKADAQYAFAGNYQTIIITIDNATHEFRTRRAFGLMNLLSDGDPNLIIEK